LTNKTEGVERRIITWFLNKEVATRLIELRNNTRKAQLATQTPNEVVAVVAAVAAAAPKKCKSLASKAHPNTQ
jgi:hypothetical protein